MTGLLGLGLTESFTLFGAPYDFRLPPDGLVQARKADLSYLKA